MNQSPPVIHVYVSYKIENKEAREELEQAFNELNNKTSDFQIKIKFSENSLKEGDSIVEFMDEIAVAGFVIFLFSKEYFESPYCLYELISAYKKHKNIEKHLNDWFFIKLIKFQGNSDFVNSLTVESIIDGWKNTDLKEEKNDCQNKLK